MEQKKLGCAVQLMVEAKPGVSWLVVSNRKGEILDKIDISDYGGFCRMILNIKNQIKEHLLEQEFLCECRSNNFQLSRQTKGREPTAEYEDISSDDEPACGSKSTMKRALSDGEIKY